MHHVRNCFALLTKNQKNIVTKASVAEGTEYWSHFEMNFSTYNKRMQ